MAVAFSAKASVDTEANPLTATVSSSLMTVGASDTALVVTTTIAVTSGTLSGSGITCTGMTWNGVAMTQLGVATSSDGTFATYLFGLASPAIGNKTLVASYGGTLTNAQGYLDAASFTGTATTTAVAFPSGDVLTDASTPAGVVYPASPFSVTTVSGDAALASMNNVAIQFSGPSSGNGTLIRTDANIQGNDCWIYKLATSTSTTVQFTGGNGTSLCCGVAIHIAQPSGGLVLNEQPMIFMRSRLGWRRRKKIWVPEPAWVMRAAA